MRERLKVRRKLNFKDNGELQTNKDFQYRYFNLFTLKTFDWLRLSTQLDLNFKEPTRYTTDTKPQKQTKEHQSKLY